MIARLRELEEAERFLEGRVAANRRAEVARLASRAGLLRSFLFDKEIALADDPHRYVSACCGRRAGKTTTVGVMMLQAALRNPGRSVLYLTITRDHAKGIIWGPLKQLNEQFGLGGVPNETDLTLTMPNGAVIALRGVDKRKEIEKRRGYGFALVVIDECQSIPDYVRQLVDDVIGPALMDVPGRLVMVGTPSLVVGGYWYECHHNTNTGDDGRLLWGHHRWTVHDNPHIKNPDEVIRAEAARRGVSVDDASMQREYGGRWVRDVSSAVFTFDPERNIYSVLPDLDPGGWRYVIAVDIGGGVKRDNDAVTVLGFHRHKRAAYLLEEHIDPTQDVTALADLVKGIVARRGRRNVVAIVADTGGLGAKVAREMESRHRLPVTAAKKTDKWANIALLNAACNHGEFFAPKDSEFALECVKVEKDWEKSTPDHIEIKGHMPDVCDSVIYGYVDCLEWLAKPAPKTQEEQRAEMAAIVKRAGTPPTAEEMNAKARREMEEYAKEMGRREREQQRRDEADWGSW